MKNKIYKLLSIVLAVMIVFSCCTVAFTVSAETSTVPVYYVSTDSGSDDAAGLTNTTPVLTVNKAIQLATLAGYDADDTVYLKVMGTTAVAWGGTQSSSNATVYLLDDHSFKLNISSETSGATVGDNTSSVVLGGPVDFENVIVWISSYPNYYALYANDNPVNFANDVTIREQNVAGIMLGGYASPAETTGDLSYNFDVETSTQATDTDYKISTSVGNGWGAKTYSGNVTLNFNNKDLKTALRLSSSDGATTFKKNLNLNIKDAAMFIFNTNAAAPVFDGGALQIINSAGIALTDTNSALANIDSTYKYILTNTTTQYKNALEFTDTTGIFDVKEGYSVTAIKADDTSVVINSAAPEGSQDVVLDLTAEGAGAGEYNLTITKTPETKVVYVSADGSVLGDGAETNPVSTIREAIQLGIDAGLDTVDTLNIKTVGSAVNAGVILEYDFNLHVESADSATKTTITIDTPMAYNGTNSYMLANGGSDTTARYSNVEIKMASSGTLSLNNTNAVFDDDVTFTNVSGIYYNRHRTLTAGTRSIGGQSVEFNAAPQRVWLTNGNHGKVSFTDDVNLTVNSASLRYVRFTSDWAATIYEKNVNVHVKNAHASFAFEAGNSGGSTINGALQVIDSAGLGLGTASTSSLSYLTAATQWFITNSTGNADAISFTTTAGLYKVNLDTNLWTVTATDADGNVVAEEASGYLDLTAEEAGAYTVVAEKKAGVSTTYYISSTGSDSAAGTKDKPLLSVDGAINKANAIGYGEGHTVNVVLCSDTTWFADTTSSSSSAHAFKVAVASETGSKYTLKYNQSLILSGDVSFEDVTVSYTTNWGAFMFAGNNVTFGENVTLDTNNSFAIGYNGGNNTSDAQTVIFNSYINKKIRFQNRNNQKMTYTGDVNIILNNATSKPTMGFASDYSGGSLELTDGSNFNIIVKDAASLTLSNWNNAVTATIDGALQLIVNKPDSTTIDDTSISYISTAGTYNKGFYYIKNSTGLDDVITPVSQRAGEFSVNVNNEFYNLKVADADGNDVTDTAVAKSGEGYYVTLDTAGTYTISAERITQTATYYISASEGASDNAGTEEAPLITVEEAINAAVEKGYVAGDIVTVVVKDDTTWGATATPTHGFKLIVKSADAANRATLTITTGTILAGEVELQDIIASVTTSEPKFSLNGSNLTVGENVTFSPRYFVLGTFNTTPDIAGQKVVINNALTTPYFYLGNDGHHNGRNFTDDVNVVFNNSSAVANFSFHTGYGGTMTYDKNLNLDLMSVKTVNFASGTSGRVKVTGAIQIYLNDPTTTFTAENKANLVASAEDGSSNVIYYLTNNTGLDDVIDFVPGVAGKYKVNLDASRFNVTFTDADGNEYTPDDNGYVTLATTGGEYSITVTKEQESTTIYAQTGATGENDTYATIGAAVKAAIGKGYTTGDTVTVTVKGTDAVLWGGEANKDGDLQIPAHGFKLVINSADGTGIVGDGTGIIMGGTTHFENINVMFGSAYAAIMADGNDVTFASTATYSGNKDMSYFRLGKARNSAVTSNYTDPVNIEAGIPIKYFYIANGYHDTTFNKDINITYNASSGTPKFILGADSGATIINANLNFNLKALSSLTFESKGNGYTFGENAAVQIINSTDADVTSSTGILADITAPKWIITNNSGDADILTFTTVAGVYGVNGTETVYAYKDGVKVAESNDGTLDLTSVGVGEYVLIKVRDPKTFEYTNADGTTIADIIDKAIDDGAIEGDTVKITLSGTTAVEYGTPVEHLFDVELISTESTPVTFVNNAVLAGDTKFDGIKINAGTALAFGGHDVEFTASTTRSGASYMYTGAVSGSPTYTSQKIVFSTAGGMYLTLGSDGTGTTTYDGDLELIFNCDYNPYIYITMHGTTTYNGRVNLDIGSSNSPSFNKITSATFNGGLNIISESALTDAAYTALASATGNVYTVYNKTGVEGILGFGSKSGEFTVSGDDTVRAIEATREVAYSDSKDGVLTLNGAGNFFVGLPHVYSDTESTYADYIDYRTALNGNNALNNFAAKVKAGEAVNVVYYGGSVTAGSGASVADKTSWRGIVSSWLEINAPQSTVTNVNSAIGGTGSHFGYYRLQGAVLDKNPDLLFIEFSINDYYDNQDLWNIGETEAAMQMESIIRKVRTEKLDCDIVMVLTTDRDQIAALQTSDTLHKQARGHYKIAEKYGIPTIRVGHALADQLYTDMDGVTFDYSTEAAKTAWSKYFPLTSAGSYDIVHPNDTGYRIYANVIEEFMANSLLSDTNKNAVVTNHTVPEYLASAEIWAGDVTFIQADAALSAESKELGGSEFAVAVGREYPYHASTYRMNDPEAVLKFKFTGTELSVLDDQYSNAYQGFNVKIDGGEEKYVEIRNYKPTVLASGLENVEHTAEVRIAEIVSSNTDNVGQWVYGFFVRNEADDIQKKSETKEYYVSSEGLSTNPGTQAEPVPTIVDAINLAKEYGLTAADTAKIYVDGSKEAVRWGYTSSTSDDYLFNLHVESLDSNTAATLTYGQPTIKEGETVVQSSQSDIMRGNTTVDNIIIKDLSGNNRLNLAGYSVTFGANAVFSNVNNINSSNQQQTISKAQTVVFNNTFSGTFRVGNHNYAGVKYNADLNICVNNASSKFNFTFGCAYGGDVNNFNGNVNFIINDAASVSFGVVSGTSGLNGNTWASYANAAVQVLMPSDITLSDESRANLEAWMTTENLYYLVDDLGEAGKVNFVQGELGKFNINGTNPELYNIVLENPDGSELPITGNSVVLSEPGDYVLTSAKVSRNASYEVSTGGTLATIGAAINKAVSDGYGENDTVTVTVSGTEAILWGGEANVDQNQQLPAHDFKLIVTSKDSTVTVGDGTPIILGGDTYFENITINFGGTSSNYPSMNFDGNNVEFASTVTYGGTKEYSQVGLGKNRNYAVQAVYDEAINVVSAMPFFRMNLGNDYHTATFNEDVNITYNAASGTPKFIFGAGQSGVSTFNADLNFNFKAATSVSFDTTGGGFAFGENAALQIINSTSVDIGSDYNVISDITVPKYIITNKTGNADAISFTETAGTYNLDIPQKDEGYFALITNVGTGEVIQAKNDSVTLEAGEYTVEISRNPEEKEYTVTSGTLADAIQTAIDDGCGYGDTVTIYIDTETRTMELGTLPEYRFNLVVEALGDTQTTIDVAGSIIANNMGLHTHYKNIYFHFTDTDTSVSLANSNVTFAEDVTFKGGWNNTIAFGTSNDEGRAKVVEKDQTVVLDGEFLTADGTSTSIALSNTAWANKTYEGDVNLVVNNSKATPVVLFNAYYSGNANGQTTYKGNVAINVKNAESLAFSNKYNADGDSVYTSAGAELIVNGNTTISDKDLQWFQQDFAEGMYYHLIDNTFQRRVVELTDEPGVYKLNTDLEVTATLVNYFDADTSEYVEDGITTITSKDGILDIYNEAYDYDYGYYGEGYGTWVLTTNEYFEDFNDMSDEDFATDWTSNHATYNGVCEITDDGKVLIESVNGVPNKNCIFKNRNIGSLTQYVSVDIDPEGFKSYDAGTALYARVSENQKVYYSASLVNGLVRVNKFLGEENSSGNYQATSEGWETTGLIDRLPNYSNNSVTFNNDHNYRMGMSVVDKDGVAYIRAFILNLNTNELIFDETFKDTQPLTDTGVGFATHGSADTTSNDYCNVYYDNFYFSTEGFRTGDLGQTEGDINRDGVYDIRDLVYTNEAIEDTTVEINVYDADKDQSGSVDVGDLPVIRKELLTGVDTSEYNYQGYADAEADALREQILGSTSELNGKVYTSYNNGETIVNHTITNNIWYVSSNATGNGDGKSPSSPWTIAQLNENSDGGAAGTTVDDCTIKSGDAVLFERDSVFRAGDVDTLFLDVSTDGSSLDSYSYITAQEGVLYGAYGTGDKPRFIGSAKNYATDVTWEATGQENIWVVDAPEIIIDNGGTKDSDDDGRAVADNEASGMYFNGGASFGDRRDFTSASDLYNLFKDGQFTFDENTGKLYLYSSKGSPNVVYDSIDVTRGFSAISVNTGEGNVVIDNLAIEGFGTGGIGSTYGTNAVSITNCEFAYIGGVRTANKGVRMGNAVGLWCGGYDYKVNHNWIYQTFDSAISPQGNTAISYDGFEVIGNLLEYNNCDIEIFDRGSSADDAKSATWDNVKWTDNIMRFTTLGWGSKQTNEIRGIQGVIRAVLTDASVVSIDWSNNIIDSPGMEIVKFNNTTDYEVEGEGDSAKDVPLGIWTFGTNYTDDGETANGTSNLGNNKYYLNPYLRAGRYIATDYMTMLPSEGSAEDTNRTAMTADEFYNSMSVIDTSETAEFYWLGKKIN